MSTIQTRRLTLEEQRMLVTECRSSDMPASMWLKEHGVYEGTYYTWFKQLKKTFCDLSEPI